MVSTIVKVKRVSMASALFLVDDWVPVMTLQASEPVCLPELDLMSCCD